MTDARPVNYRLCFKPDLSAFTFTGLAEIELDISRPVTRLSLDARELDVRSVTLRDKGKTAACVFKIRPEKEALDISFPEAVAGTVSLTIDYTGHINDKMAGFYRSAYGPAGARRYIGVTQFQESDARRAFPCFDHPMHKAVFDIEIELDATLTAISNEVVEEETDLDNGKKRVRFRRTPKMSTYLVFWGIGDFKIQADAETDRVRVITLPGREPYARFGLDFGKKALRFCEAYFGIPYPLAKLDLIAIPDFAFGAMENWGAVTFRENLLLYYPETTSKAGEERICEVIAHEIVHQWFGNLVTPGDWKYLWLNESFATYFGFGVVDHHHPGWGIWPQFLSTMTESALERDALKETFAIELPGDSPVAINAATAPIIYNKGGSILRQVRGYIGDHLFKEGLRTFLKSHTYGCAASNDLWRAFESVSDKPITRMMQSWIEQPGFPVVEVKREAGDLILTQRRFTYLPNRNDPTWLIPLRIAVFDASENTEEMSTLMDQKTIRLTIGEKAAAYKINAGQTAFFRTLYRDAENSDALGRLIRSKGIPPEDRWGLENDRFALVKSTDVSLDEYLDFLNHFHTEDAFLPLMSIAGNLFQAYLISCSRTRTRVAVFGKPFVERILDAIGREPAEKEAHTTAILRDRILWHAILYGSSAIDAFAQKKFDALRRGAPVHPDIQKSVMQAGAWGAGEGARTWLEKRFDTSDSEHERLNLLTALGCFRERATLERALQFTIDAVPDRNKFIPIVSAATNPAAVPFMWSWYRSHLSELENFHPLLYERIISGIIPVCGMESPDDVDSFFETYLKKEKTPSDVIRMALEGLAINLRWRPVD